MPKKPIKIKPGSGLAQLSFLLDSTLAHEIDEYAKKLTEEDPDRPVTRTVALRKIIRAGLDALRTK